MSKTQWGASKTVPGQALSRVEELEDAVRTGSWLFFRRRAYHPRFVTNMSFSVVLAHLRHGEIAWAMERETPEKHYRSEESRMRRFQAPVTSRMEAARG